VSAWCPPIWRSPLIEQGRLVALPLQRPFPSSPSCIAWVQNNHSPAMSWLLEYLGDTDTLSQEWLNDPDEQDH
jgi:DNA-binding transcriptional LysR family regulator